MPLASFSSASVTGSSVGAVTTDTNISHLPSIVTYVPYVSARHAAVGVRRHYSLFSCYIYTIIKYIASIYFNNPAFAHHPVSASWCGKVVGMRGVRVSVMLLFLLAFAFSLLLLGFLGVCDFIYLPSFSHCE
jgi:hypothetical protein